MKNVLRGATALAAAMIAAPISAQAEEGWYGRADVGYGFDDSLDLSGPTINPAPSLNSAAEFDADWTQHLGLGYGFGKGLRLEGEFAHRYNDFEGSSSIREGGGAHAWSGMINGFVDFTLGPVMPYLGVGVGYAQVTASASTPSLAQSFDDSDSGFAYQGLAGLALPISERLKLDVGYRYFSAPDLEFEGFSNGAPATFEGDYVHHAATVGLRWQFAAAEPAPPPPPPPAPPPPPPPPPVAPVAEVCPGQDFKVYFEWNKSALNAAALETINAAAARAKECNVSTVNVTGFTDTSGSPAYNLRLSNTRATVVADALVAAGLPAGVISASGAGETGLDKATADGVREPLNRRTAVTITFQ